MKLKQTLILRLVFLLSIVSCSLGSGAKKSYLLAERLWESGNYAEAAVEFKKVIRQDSQGRLGLQSLFRLAMTQAIFLSEPREAVVNFQQFSQRSINAESKWTAQKQIGEIYFSQLKDYTSAITHYQNLVEQNPKHSDVPLFLFRIARAYFFLWNFDKSFEILDELRKQYSDSPWSQRALFYQGMTLFTSGNEEEMGVVVAQKVYEKALVIFDQFLSLYPKSSLYNQALFGKANVLEELDRLEEADQIYESLVSYPSFQVINIKRIRIRERISQRVR